MTRDAFSLDGKCALVTGASRGLGQGIAVALAESGADVAVADIAALNPEQTVARISAAGRRAVALSGDLSRPEVPDQLFAQAVAQLGRVDILVNNAGIIRRSPAVDFSDKDWQDVIDVNLNAVFKLCRAAGRHMLAGGHGGKIVNIASLLAFQGGILVPSYAAAKGAVAQLTKALANEWAAKGINVNAIAPGYMATDNTAPLRADEARSRQILERIPAGRWGLPGDVGSVAVFLASSAAEYVNGHVLVVDGGWMAR
jgi:2-dehydro-3-deoxy-D-gluconate 5-dehydrogenase